MKERFENKKLQIVIPLVVFGVVLISAIIFSAIKWQQANEEQKRLIKTEVAGIIVGYRDLTRGDYEFRIQGDGEIVVYCFHNFDDINRVQSGDSIYKPVNSMTLHLFKNEVSGFVDNGIEEIGF